MPLGTVLPFLRNRVLGNAFGFAAGAAMSDVFTPPMANLAAEFWRQFPNRRLPAEIAAQAVVRNYLDFPAGEREAAESGIDGGRFGALVRLAGSAPGQADLLELFRRNDISEAIFREGLRRNGLKLEYVDELVKLRRALLAPSTAATLVAANVLTPAEGTALAARGGLAESDFLAMVTQAESAPAPGETLDLLNRGELSEAEARTALRRAGIEPRYVDPILALRNVQPGPQDLIRFMVREVFDAGIRQEFGLDEEYPTQASALGRRIGLSEEVMKQYWAAHWDLPSPEQGFRMFHRSIIDRSRLARLLKALDFMPGWRDELIQLAFLVPGRIDLRRMFVAGVRTREQTKRGYLDLGYSPADAEILTDFATTEKLQREVDLSKAEIVRLYEIRAIPRAEAIKLLQEMGYEQREQNLILQLADYRNAKTKKDALIAAVKNHFIAGRIGVNEATQKLDEAQIPAAERDDYLELWQWEQVLRAPDISVAQMQALLKRGELTRATFIEHMKQRGYSEQEAEWLAILATPATTPAGRFTTPSEYRSLFKVGKITDAEFRAGMAALGYAPIDVDRQVKLAEAELTVAQWQKLVKIGEATELEFLAEMKRRQYSEQEAKHLLTIATASTAQPPS